MSESSLIAVLSFIGGIVAVIIPSLIQIRKWRDDARLRDARAAKTQAEAEKSLAERKTIDAQTAAALVGAAGKLVEDYLSSTQVLKAQVLDLQNGLKETRLEHAAEIEHLRQSHSAEIAALRARYESDLESMQRQVTALSVRNAELERALATAQGREAELTREVGAMRAAMQSIKGNLGKD